MGGGAEFFELLAGEDIDGDEMDLGVAVLAGLGGGHVDDLAWAVLDDDETVLSQGRALHRERGRCTGIGRLEGVLMLGGEGTQLACMLLSASQSWVTSRDRDDGGGGGDGCSRNEACGWLSTGFDSTRLDSTAMRQPSPNLNQNSAAYLGVVVGHDDLSFRSFWGVRMGSGEGGGEGSREC